MAMWIHLVLVVSCLSVAFTFCHSSSSQPPLCHADDRAALLQFKQSFVFDSFACPPSAYAYTTVASWTLVVAGETADCCSWDGVDCDKDSGRVIGLDLTSSCLYGSINSSSPIFWLVHLRYLNLSFNNFNLSRIPPSIRNLSSLTHLNLSDSNFSGQIPSEILELSHLVSLDLSVNQLKLQEPSLRDLVATLNRLNNLHLSEVAIASSVPQSLVNLSSLSSLFLRDCSLHGEFPSEIFQLPNLRSLSLRYNPDLTGYIPEFDVEKPLEMLMLEDTDFSGKLPGSIGSLKSLTTFSAMGCQFSGSIPSSLGNLSNLKYLDLSNNNFSGQIPSSFSNLFQLAYLSISSNNFSPSTLYWLGNLTSIYFLDLEHTNSYGDIPLSFKNLTQLTHLWLSFNNLTGEVPTWLGNLTQSFRLSANKLHGSIPDSVFELPNLQQLEIRSNLLSGNLNLDTILKARNLVELQLSANHFSLIGNPARVNVTVPMFGILALSSCNLRKFPSFLRGQNELEILDLSDNYIEGLVPSWITDLCIETLGILNLASNFLRGFEKPLVVLPWTNLLVLNLTSNFLQGSLPIPQPSIFVYLVSNNNFSGELSPMICNLPSLLTLDLSDNNLSGKLPQCLADKINHLAVLSLRNNSFSGNIPDRFITGCRFEMIDFSLNKLEGKIPRSLVNCTKLETLDLGNNEVNDIFPSWLGALAELKVLILRSNKLHGAIEKPGSKFEFSHLQVIDISDNGFTGQLPWQYFQSWNAMRSVDKTHLGYMHANASFQTKNFSWSNYYRYSITMRNRAIDRMYEGILEFFVAIDLSSNSFEGKIPDAIGNLREVKLLNLSNNILSGHIPYSLGNLTELETLDLSMNKLSGEIPMQLTQLYFLAFFNVSHNFLNGPIPRGNQFETFQNNSFSDNSGLCGYPLSRKCGDGVNSSSGPTVTEEDHDSGFALEFGWKVVAMGYASGLVIGVLIGCIVKMDLKKMELPVKTFSIFRKFY